MKWTVNSFSESTILYSACDWEVQGECVPISLYLYGQCTVCQPLEGSNVIFVHPFVSLCTAIQNPWSKGIIYCHLY